MKDQPTKIKCSARFRVVIAKLMQLDNIEFELDPQDEGVSVIIDSSLIKEYLNEMWCRGKIDPMDGLEYREEEGDGFIGWEDEIDEIVSFEVIKPKKFVDPNQVDTFN